MDNLVDGALNIYTDGSCYSSPRVGGTGFLFIVLDEKDEPEIYEESPPGWNGATNNQMELQACVEALKMATGRHPPIDPARYGKIVICTDSMYVSENYSRAIYEWSGNGWATRDGAPVLNTPQWKELLKLVRRADRTRKRVQITWVKGHGKDVFNKRADRLAKQSAKAPAEQTIRPARVRRKKSPNKVQVGSVRMEGQVLTVRIVVDEFLPAPHKCYRYMYEVMDEQSPFYQRVDKITSDVVLSAGHTYSVRVNSDQGNPRIEEMFEEIIEAGSRPD